MAGGRQNKRKLKKATRIYLQNERNQWNRENGGGGAGAGGARRGWLQAGQTRPLMPLRQRVKDGWTLGLTEKESRVKFDFASSSPPNRRDSEGGSRTENRVPFEPKITVVHCRNYQSSHFDPSHGGGDVEAAFGNNNSPSEEDKEGKDFFGLRRHHHQAVFATADCLDDVAARRHIKSSNRRRKSKSKDVVGMKKVSGRHNVSYEAPDTPYSAPSTVRRPRHLSSPTAASIFASPVPSVITSSKASASSSPRSSPTSSLLSSSPLSSAVHRRPAILDVNSLAPIIPSSFQRIPLSHLHKNNKRRLVDPFSSGVRPTLNQRLLCEFLHGEKHPTSVLIHVCYAFGLSLGMTDSWNNIHSNTLCLTIGLCPLLLRHELTD